MRRKPGGTTMRVMTAPSQQPSHAGSMLAPVETLGGIIRAQNNHSAADVAACFASNGELRVIPTGDVARGREQIVARVEPQFRAFPDWHVERRGFYACGEVAWVEWAVAGTHAGEFMGYRPTHRGVELRGCSSFMFAPDGLIAVEDLYFDPATMLRQLGLI
jgi:steroid delta-isomerase-like uncharacterized protein